MVPRKGVRVLTTKQTNDWWPRRKSLDYFKKQNRPPWLRMAGSC
jgi:hypothetical protein